MALALTPTGPRALMIAPAMPAETGHGLAMRMGVFLEALARIAEVDLAVIPVVARSDLASALIARLGVRATVIPCADRLDTHFKLLSRLADPKARLDAFVHYGRPQLSAALSTPVMQDLRALIAGRRYDLIHVGRAYLAPAVQQWMGRGAKLSLDLDEDDWATLESIARLDARAGRCETAAWRRAEASAYDRLVAEFAPSFDRLWISCKLDRRSLRARHPKLESIVVVNCVSSARARPQLDDGRTLLFVGSFGYSPNVDAVLWFARTVWPTLYSRDRRLRLLVVGADALPALRSLPSRSGIVLAGPVDDLASVYAQASLALVPLRAGGGTRIKLLEAASHGVAVVSTTIGAAGLPVRRFCCGWIADPAECFAAACLTGLSNVAERSRRGARGRAMVRREYERSRIVRDLACAFAALLIK
jgi:glycosyltransferase involved in cell wall biosynthesis